MWWRQANAQETQARLQKHRARHLQGAGNRIGAIIESKTGLETRVSTLGYVQRGGTPVAYDRSLATSFGVKAIDLIDAKKFGEMTALRQNRITGVPLEQAKTLVIQLNAGALPVPLTLIQQQDVSATLGTDSLNKSLIAGIIGLALVFAFMTAYYRLPGFVAALALIVYATIALALFKLVPVTLSLAGVAAFILSVGMAVDANVLVFERMKEELQWGKSLGAAMEAGFDRAWTSIRDSNVSTLITCVILYWFGSSFGATLVMGFALTLGVGVVVSMFTAIVVARCFLRFVVNTGLSEHLGLFRVPGQTARTSGGESK